MNRKVLIVGTGLGGLSAGLRLATKGYDVQFVEKEHNPGGRLNQIKKDGFTFDAGPSFFSMPYEFEELAKECGIDIPFEFVELDPLYVVNFRGSDRKFFLHKDPGKLAEQFNDLEPGFDRKFSAYMKKCGDLYDDTVDIVIKQNFDNLPLYLLALLTVNPKHLGVLFKTFWEQTGKYFRSREVRQIVSLIAFFLGRTPFDTNAVYTLLSHIEFVNKGYYNVKGGMYKIVEGMTGQLNSMGASIAYNTEITGFEANGTKLKSFIDKRGKHWEADIFLVNGDAALFRGEVFGRKEYSAKKLSRMSWTMGYLTFYIGLNTKLPQVEHHNYFLGNNYEKYAKDVTRNPGSLEKPYYYVNVVSKFNPRCSPAGCEALFFVCPVPNLMYKADWSDKEEIIDSIITDFSERIHQDISENIVLKLSYTPEDWMKRYNLYMGAGLGLSHTMSQIGGFRPSNVDEKFKNTFYAGASTIPGAGLPMAIISSKLAVERILNY